MEVLARETKKSLSFDNSKNVKMSTPEDNYEDDLRSIEQSVMEIKKSEQQSLGKI